MKDRPLRRMPVDWLPRGKSANDSRADSAETHEDARETRDPHVARALAAMKAAPARRWTVVALARVGGLSRAAFARRFRLAVGTSPLRWLAEHRLRTARTLLVSTDAPLAGVAADVGYASEFSFGKAFKRLFGVAPGVFRRRVLTRASATLRAAA